jgi:SAM-dependent methyltransferase
MNYSKGSSNEARPFGDYSNYYDVFYSQKNYGNEIEFIQSIFATKNINITSILDLGCGTGGHAVPLANKGFQIHGVDISETMLDRAKLKLNEVGHKACFSLCDIRHFRDEKKYDLVISMFAVMSYQTGNTDVEQVLQTARYHLEPGHLFIFDAWHGPAVLKQKPETRVSEIPLPDGRLFRIAQPESHIGANTADVNFTLLKLIGNLLVEETHETHTMRYFFLPEIEYFASKNGFKVIKTCPFLQADKYPTEDDWNVTWVLEAI